MTKLTKTERFLIMFALGYAFGAVFIKKVKGYKANSFQALARKLMSHEILLEPGKEDK